MKSCPNVKQTIARTMALIYVAVAVPAEAALTDLTSQPLANIAGTATVKPNIMFLLDDSGSMMQQYTPDYVSERWGGPAASDRHCYDSGDDTDTNRDLCIFGDPPYMSPDFNKQYYNPDIAYAPPTSWDGVPYPSQTAANTSNWTAVKTDGFNIQNINHFEQGNTAWNIAAQYPSRAWCVNVGDDPNSPANNPSCVTNSGGYYYPDATFKRGQDGTVNFNNSPGGTGSTVTHAKFRYGNPYYYRILPGEYCTDEALTNCVSVALGSTPPFPAPNDGHVYPARVRWCNSEANAVAATPAAGSCQAKKVGSFQYARFSITSPASKAYGTIKIGSSGSNNPVTITQVQVNGVTVMNNTLTAGGGTNSSGERNTMANNLAAAINAYHAAPGSFYAACAGTACNAILGAGLIPSDTVAIIPTATSGGVDYITDASHAGEVIAVTAPVNNISPSRGSITIGNSGSGSGNITSITVGPSGGPYVEVLNNSLSNFGNNSTINRNAAARAVESRIDGYANGAPWEYTARYYGQNVSPWGSCSNTTTTGRVCIDAPLSAGSAPNGYIINVTTVGGVSVSVSNFGAQSGTAGVSRFIPTTITNIGAGTAATSAYQRVDIAPATTTYPKATARTDCASTPGVCTYDEEMTNFANWYAYYRTRMQTMKSAVGHAFLPLNNEYRLGFTTINNTTFTGTSGTRWLALDALEAAQKQNWYAKLYAQNASGSTPLREALDRMGKLYESTLSGAPDPMEFSCQQNFTILTTDGYWNGGTNSAIGDQDNVESTARFCSRENGCFDGNLGGGAAASLADVALYYYYRDLRTDLTDNVPTTTKDPNPAQHMTTFTLGLGVDGVMTYREDYETAAAGDFYRIRTGATGCTWTAGTCNWPVPVSNGETAVDDLWHAAVNGHGTFFSAQDPASLSQGLASALAGLQVRNAAASASATSTPNVTQEDNDIFSATFRTVKWDGELVAQKIDTATGNLLPDITWSAQSLLDDKVSDSSDSRIIYTADLSTPTPSRKTFEWASLTSSEQAHFQDKCLGGDPLTQCSGFDAAQKTQANLGDKMLNYLRGQQEMEVTDPPIYRVRDHAFGDIASAKPAYVRNPRRNYGDVGYSVYKAAQAGRQAMVYVAANDGFLHALNATTGDEAWAYVPHATYPDFHKLADSNYGNNHRYYVDGSPESGDVFIGGQWRTILVGGLNKGGRGYYALDITEPTNPLVLWEFCSDSALCSVADTDLGYTFGNPIITKRPSDGKWVVLVASGYNNVSPGSGRGFLYVLDAETGQVLSKIDTGIGDTTTPSGLARITGRAENAVTDNTATTIFGGDLLGNLWRFDMTANTVIKLASLTDDLAAPQPITTRPDVGKCHDTPMVFVGTGRYLGLGDLTDLQLQSIWGIKDNSATLGTLRTNSMVQQNFSAAGGGTYTISSNDVDLASQNGWFVDLDQNSGERVNLDPALVLGTLVVVTNQPESISACTTGGNSFKYEFDFCSGKALLASGGTVGKKIGSSIAVGFIVIRLPSGALKVITTFAGSEKTTEGVTAGSSGNTRRVSWRELQ
ncbi:MAG: PilC/PilY family type IV pilus protein [Rhodocyclaceae bacterium]